MSHARKENWKKVGYVGIDSGTLLLTDPSYLKDLPEYEEMVGLKKSNRVSKRLTNKNTNTAKIKIGGSEALISDTGFGDGKYPVYAKITDEGKLGKRVSELKVKFI